MIAEDGLFAAFMGVIVLLIISLFVVLALSFVGPQYQTYRFFAQNCTPVDAGVYRCVGAPITGNWSKLPWQEVTPGVNY